MLQQLQISNYAIIDELTLRFPRGLNVITGETGAGKSILMGALGLILGQRADIAMLRHADKKCVIEASFIIAKNTEVNNFFLVNDLDLADEILLRREITAAGKSRGFINDTPATLSQMRTLSSLLVDLHQQFDTMELGESRFQREVIDAVAEVGDLLQQLSVEYKTLSQLVATYNRLQREQAEAEKDRDYNQYLFDEFHALSLQPGELERLDEELKILSNAEEIKQGFAAVEQAINEGEEPLLPALKMLLQKLKSLQALHPAVAGLPERINSSLLEIEDVAAELSKINDHVVIDESRLQIVNDRIAEGYKLLKKHDAKTTEELLVIAVGIESKLVTADSRAEEIKVLGEAVLAKKNTCLKIANDISKGRKKVAEPFCKQVNSLLAKVGMPNAKIKVQVTEAPLSVTGVDDVVFLFDANNSNKFEPLSKVASGGELSRLMLSVKSLVAKKLALPTLIFDEIDSGISGEAAKQVSLIMDDLAKAHQLIVISHQPQIAARAATHFYVYKHAKEKAIHTDVKILTEAERITSIAQMIGGENPGKAAIANARELITGQTENV